jgi:parallel beta-helix repeat protein
MKKLLLVLFFTMYPVFAQGATYYVAPTGQSGCSQNTNSPQGGINNGIGCLASGDTLIVKSGVYTQAMNSNSIPNGSAGAPTIVKSEVKRGAIIRHTSGSAIQLSAGKSNITIDGFVIDPNNVYGAGGLDLNAQNGLTNILIQGVEIKNFKADDFTPNPTTGNYGTTAGIGASWTATNVIMRDLYVHDIGTNCNGGNCCNECFGYGIYLSGNGYTLENSEFGNTSGWIVHGYAGGAPAASNNIVRNNYFHDSGGPVLLCQSNNQIYNNIIVRLGTIGNRIGPGIQLAGACHGEASSNNMVYNNTVYQSGGPCIDLGSSGNGTVRNNICYQNRNDAVQGGGSGNVVSNNLLGQNPLFVNASAGDFHLQNGSPAIDAGVVMPGLSYRGSAPDLGALEAGADGQLPAPTKLRLIGN